MEIIKTSKHDKNLGQIAKVFRFVFSSPVMNLKPFIMTFRKREMYFKEHLPTKIFVIYFGRFMYQFFLLNDKDYFLYTVGEKCSWIKLPPYCNSKENYVKGEEVDLSNFSPQKEDVDSIVIHFD